MTLAAMSSVCYNSVAPFFFLKYLKSESVTISKESFYPNSLNQRDLEKIQFSTKKPKNVILMIADGVSSAHYLLTRYHYYGTNGRLSLEQLPQIAIVNTNSLDNSIITDSAASATAMSTGVRTLNGYAGVDEKGERRPHLLDKLMQKGVQVALMTTGDLSSATPAGFASHNVSRSNKVEIANVYLKKRIPLLIGGDEDIVSLNGNMFSEEAQRRGYHIIRDQKSFYEDWELPAIVHFNGLSDCDDCELKDKEIPSLADMTDHILPFLQKRSPQGFFIMIEEDGPDYFAHLNDASHMMEKLRNFDSAVESAIRFVKNNPDTLLIVTSDHETGGLVIVDGHLDKGTVDIKWTTNEHTAVPVPLYAFGPSANHFSGVIENSDLHHLIFNLFQ